jgi:hypothetical protein
VFPQPFYKYSANHLLQIQHNVRPDSNLILHAAREVVEEEEFDAILEGVRDRVDEIESLHRTRELTVRSFHPIFPYLSLRKWFLL